MVDFTKGRLVYASITLVLLHNISLFGAFRGTPHCAYLWRHVLDVSHRVFIKSRPVPNPFPILCSALFILHFLFHSFFCSFFFSNMSATACDSGANAGASRFAGRSKDTRADLPFLESVFICKYGVFLDSHRLVARWMNGDYGFVSDVQFRYCPGRPEEEVMSVWWSQVLY